MTERRVIIVGAGGHGREVADVLRRQRDAGAPVSFLGFIDDDADLHGRTVGGAPVLGDWAWFEGVDRSDVQVIVAVGTPSVNRRLVRRGAELGLAFATAVSPDAYVSEAAVLGRGVVVFPKAVVQTDAEVGDHCTINVGATVSHDAVVGRYSMVNPGAHVAGGVRIGEGCYVGMGANIIQGTTVGSWTTIGAGAVVIRDLPESVTAVGVPARVLQKPGNP